MIRALPPAPKPPARGAGAFLPPHRPRTRAPYPRRRNRAGLAAAPAGAIARPGPSAEARARSRDGEPGRWGACRRTPAQSDAAWRMWPPVWVPIAKRPPPAATAAALPPDDPPGTRERSQGLWVGNHAE